MNYNYKMINYSIICDKHNLTPTSIIIPKRGTREAISTKKLLEILLVYGKNSHTHIGMHNSTLVKYIKKLFPELNLLSVSRRGWDNWLMYESGYKKCSKCHEIKLLDSYNKDTSRIDMLSALCRECAKDKNANYYNKNKESWSGYNANRRARIEKAIPPWADLQAIQNIYNNCPEGYHVDHIYPLKGENSCGLHVENNLQYLPKADNLRKGNKLPEEVPHIIGIIP